MAIKLVYGGYHHFQQYFSYIMQSVLLVEETEVPRPEKTNILSQVNDKLYHIILLNFEILEGIIGIFTFHRCYVHLCH
jgi:hypothetical protein